MTYIVVGDDAYVTNKTMKTIAEVKADKTSVIGLSKKLEDCGNYGVTVHLPTAEAMREWPDECLDRLAKLAGKHLLQHGASQHNRRAFGIGVVAKKDGTMPELPAKQPDFYLSEWVTREESSKAEQAAKAKFEKQIAEKSTAMLKALTHGGETFAKRLVANAKTYGIKEWPKADAWESIDAKKCEEYQRAKAAYEAKQAEDLA